MLLIVTMAVAEEEETVDINLRDLGVKEFVEMVSEITQKNILIEEELKGKVNFVSTKPIKKSSLFKLANVILGSKGLTLLDQGEFYRVVKSQNAAGEGVTVSGDIHGETIRTVMFPLKNANAAVIRAKIKPLLGKTDQVIAFKENNVLSITSQPRTLESIAKVINAIEERGEKRSTVIRLENSNVKDIFANATNMAKKIFPQTIESETVDIFKDDATNSIILVGKSENTQRMIKYIKQLDIEGESVTQKMYVLRLKNSNVEEMEKILSQLISQMNNMTPATPTKTGEKQQKAMVVSDLERNALIILATSEQMKNIRETVSKIDIPKVQVYVKAKIVEINNNLAQQVGMRYGINGGSITSNGLFSLASNLGASPLMMSSELTSFLNTTNYEGLDSNGNPIYSTERPFTFGSDVDKLFALGAQLDLLQQNGAAHILSEPSILCTNNKEAEIYVGQTQSILTQAQQSTQGQGNIINNYSREDIGITLKVKPRLSSNNQVTLEVETQIEDVLPGSQASADRPTTTKRKVKTNAVMNNGETIILGGLIKRSGGEGQSKIPILGDIPILGEYLFGYNSDTQIEENVVIYLTPYIVRKSNDLQKLREMLSQLEEVQERYNKLVFKELDESRESGVVTPGTNPASQRIKRKPKDNLAILEGKEE